MNLLLFIIPLLATVLSDSAKINDVKDCKCDKGFEARPDADGEFKCYGILLRIVLPCNMVRRPSCKCTDATGIVTDETGTWCSTYGGGREIRRWHCENKEEWDTFFKTYPEGNHQVFL